MFQNAKRKAALLGAASTALGLTTVAAMADQAAAEAAIGAAGTTAQTIGWVVVGALALLMVIKMSKRVL